jgi:hypothetical protein
MVCKQDIIAGIYKCRNVVIIWEVYSYVTLDFQKHLYYRDFGGSVR